MPSIDEATELCSSDLDQNNREAAILCESSTSHEDPEVSIPALLAVVCHKVTKITDEISLPSDGPSQEEYNEVLPYEWFNWDLTLNWTSTSLTQSAFSPCSNGFHTQLTSKSILALEVICNNLLYMCCLQNLLRVFRELQYGPEDCVPFSVLSQHPFIQSLMENSTHHQLVVPFLS